MNKRVAFAQFDAVLSELGFKKSVIPGSHVNYEQPESEAYLVVRLHKARDMVPSYVLAGVRHDLEVQGVIVGEEFEKLLQATAA